MALYLSHGLDRFESFISISYDVFPWLIKYGERTWVLRIHVGVDRIVEVQLPVDLSGSDNNNSISDEDKLLTAYGLLNISKRLFVDATLNSRDRDTGHTIFRNLLSEDAFEVIEMELGLIYELLYTEMSLFCTPWG
ncbi:hypothetical protein LWI28_008711 [Acer negundo]|uniref:DUF4220 domain-containing protein n=1 Tax=Acer negundo TaxID=4023 RepID=A0AAD5IGG5_ACENE|nr:hypothetical protein LWI28_008711 [Acer negundo]